MRLLRLITTSLLALLLAHSSLSIAPARAESTEPFAPFSVEGNPDEEYHFEIFFPLYKYIRAPFLKIYENRDRSREYENLMLCPGGDERDYVCAVDNQTEELVDGCEGGTVGLCNRDSGEYVKDATSDPNDSCTAKANPDLGGVTKGKCSYKKRPSISRTVKGTDFSAEKPTYPKLQSEALAFTNVGTSNDISWGSQYLNSSFCDVALRKVIVVKRAKQTKSTLAQTGEWPLGWVDWGYQVGIDHDLDPDTPTVGTKTLLEISDELPDAVAAPTFGMLEMLDDMYINPGNYALLEGLGETQQAICNVINKEAGKVQPDEWFINLMSAPLYPPSFRQGYIRPTICVWNVCCPKNPDKCWVPDEMLVGIRRGLFYDTSISQSFNAALDQLFMTYPLSDAMRIYKNIVAVNPLARFASVSSEFGIPSFIHEKLYGELKDGCLKYIPWSSWKYFTQWIDYLEDDMKLGPNGECPNYKLQPTLTKDKGGAYPELNLSWFLQLAFTGWGGGDKIDEVEQVKYHLYTVPEAMGQSISELQKGYYDTRDTLANLESVQDFNEDLSSTVDDEAELLYAGKSMNPADARRRFGYYTCADPMFSSQLDTSVEEYALGTRIGCDRTVGAPGTSTTGQCLPDKFEAILADSDWKTAPSNVTSIIQNSAMFEGGILNPKLEEAYAKISEETGVPCEVLAGHHFEEATTCFTATGNPEKCSAANGGPVGEQGGFEATVRSAANGLLRHTIDTTPELITAISNFNGGGNSNCQIGFPGGTIPYGGCPRKFQGEDDPYAMNMVDGTHQSMYLLYCGDFTPCIPPKPYGQRPGVFPTALVVHEYLKTRSPAASPSTNPASSPTTPTTGTPGTGLAAFRPITCGEGSLATALGCLPYTYQPFVTALLQFLIGISGAISLSVMLTGVFRLMTSSGDAKAIQSGRDLFSAGIAGLLLVIFSVSLLRLIAADILKLPGF
ncbi:hypothetical protein KBD69_00790 [Candidatus Woesebacteria bacterium]|nr:hypothetical protein [Candidatus Woesebacteria bacterium]